MLRIIAPDIIRIQALQRRQNAFYFSGCANVIFHKHGLAADANAQNGQPDFPVFLREAVELSELQAIQHGFVEGPLDPSLAESLGLEVEARVTQKLRLGVAHDSEICTLSFPQMTVRRIPSSRAEQSEPHAWQSQDRRWNNALITYQSLKPAHGSRWQPICWGRSADSSEAEIIAVSDGTRLVFAAPVFDLLCADCAFAPLNAGYYAHTAVSNAAAFERWLVQQIVTYAQESALPLKPMPLWPHGKQAALTIRHDYDRTISAEQLLALLRAYNSRGIKSSWGFLIDNCIPEHACLIASRGHEVNLHSIAANNQQFRKECTEFTRLTGLPLHGMTAHGGIGAAGYLGQVQWQWAMEQGLEYGEMLGRVGGLPHHAILVDDSGIPRTTQLMLPATHRSLDQNTKPDGHHLLSLLKTAPQAIADGQHLVIMNHPDIHITELLGLIDSLNTRNVWNATLKDVVRWCRNRSEATIEYSGKLSTTMAAAE